MKITLDITKLKEEGRISAEEYERLLSFSRESTGSLAFNILIAFGVIAIASGALALAPNAISAIFIGAIVAAGGIILNLSPLKQWGLLSSIAILIGALLVGGGIITIGEGSVVSFLSIAILYSLSGIICRSGLLVSLAVLALSSCLGTRTAYFHASYFLSIQEPTLCVVCFSALAVGLYQLSIRLRSEFQRLALIAARTCVFLVNFGFWIGSLWGDRDQSYQVIVSDLVFTIGWAIALTVTGIWAASRNRRWVINTVATFGAIHLYTQWFERIGASPVTILFAGVTAIGLALGIWKYNKSPNTLLN